MQTVWSILALAFLATDGSPADQPAPSGPRFTITFKISDSFVLPSPKTSVETPEPDTCSRPVAAAEGHEIWQLSLPEAIRIALDNSDFIRVVNEGKPLAEAACPLMEGLKTDGMPIVIASLEPDNAARFKADAMALVRSVEQQYWNLFMAHTHLCRAVQGVSTAEEVIGNLMAELTCCRGNGLEIAEIADAALRLDWLNADVSRGVSRTVDHERRLRAIMRLPSGDNRRIVPCTNPVDQWIVAGARSALKKENRAKRKHKRDDEPRLASPNTTDSLRQLIRNVSADFKSYKKATKAADADAKRLELQTRSYQEGRIPAGPFLDFVRQHAASATAEAGCLATYNITLAAIGEASGTLLTTRDIVVAEEAPHRPDTVHAGTAKRDDQASTTSFGTVETSIDELPQIAALPELEANAASHPATAKASEVTAKTVVFSMSLGGYNWELSFANAPQPVPGCAAACPERP